MRADGASAHRRDAVTSEAEVARRVEDQNLLQFGHDSRSTGHGRVLLKSPGSAHSLSHTRAMRALAAGRRGDEHGATRH